MQLTKLHTTLFATLCAALAACSADDAFVDATQNGKTPIELSVGGVDAPSLTRAVITDGTNKTMNNFDVNTKIFMVMKSDREATAHDGYEYKGDRTGTLYTVCRGDVAANNNAVKFDATNQHYWDDAHARSSQLSIWAYAQKGENWTECSFQEIINSDKQKVDDSYKKPFYTGTTSYNWQTTEIYPAIREWNAMLGTNTVQTAQTVRCQDLLFSNNLTYNSEKSWADNRLKFNFTTHKFPNPNEMKFYHAMSKITIQIKAGEGFKADGTDFILANSKSIDQLAGFNTKGLFNIKDGEFQLIHEHKTVTSIPLVSQKTGKAEPNYVLEALAVPNIHEFMVSKRTTELPNLKDDGSRFVENSTDVMIQFTIDGNTYKIRSGALYDALKNLTEGPLTNQIKKCTDNGNYIPMEAGKNYVFTFTIGKEKINNISAQLADWIYVTATEQTPTNDYVTVSVKTDEGTHVTGAPSFALYRASGTRYAGETSEAGYNAYADYNWEKGYEKSSSLSETSNGTGIYTTEWLWPDNNTFYHLRSIAPSTETINGNDATTYINIAGGVIKEGEVTATDYIWGAPFKTTSPTPDNYSFTTGYCYNTTKENGQLYKAIGATKDNITLTQHHMSSQVFVDLETTNLSDAVELTNATVELVNIAKNGKLYLGNGLVTGYSNFGNVTMTADAHDAASPIPAYDYSYGVIPQQLSNSNGTVGIKITTTDGNVYIIDDIRTIKTGGNNINEWLPGKKYYYKFTLKKSGITNLQATIVAWETVTADNEDVTIK